MLLVEINGGIWMAGGGAHSRPGAIVRDMQRARIATQLGYRLLAYTTAEVHSGAAARELIEYLGRT